MAKKTDHKPLLYLLLFVIGLLGTALFVLLARRPLRCVLAYGLMDLAVVLLIVLLAGVGVGLAAFLPEELKRAVSSLYVGAALVLVGFILVASLLPGPLEEACQAFLPAGTTATPAPAGRFHSPVVSPSPTGLPGPTSPSLPGAVVPTVAPHPTCGAPAFWVQYTVCAGDTIYSLAEWFGISIWELRLANCLVGDRIYTGQTLWVPPYPSVPACPPGLPGPTSPSLPESVVPTVASHPTCGPPAYWVQYTVCPGDTLYSLAAWFGIGVWELRSANCLTSDAIYTGQVLWVPPQPPVPACPPGSSAPTVRPSATPEP